MLSEREQTVLRLMADGKRQAEIGQMLGVSVRAFYEVCRSLYAKLGARNEVHAVALAFRQGLLAVDRRGSTMIGQPRTQRLRSQSGQVLVLAAVGMVAICGIAGLVIDVATWYQAQRAEQAVADSAALAAVRNLPGNQAQASADAQTYAAKNGGGSPTISYSTKYMAGDTITVTASTTAPATFLKVLGIASANVSATATATAENLQSVNGAMPIAVINTQPQLSGAGCPCYGPSNPATLSLDTTGPGGL